MISFDDTEEMNNHTPLIRNIKHGVDITFKNNKYTTLITCEFTVGRNNKKGNIFNRHKKIFETMKLENNSTKTITTAGKVFEHPKDIPSRQECGRHFSFTNSIQKQRKVFVCCKIESELRVGKFKYGDKSMMHILIENNIFVRFNKYNTHQEDSNGRLKYIN